MVDVTTSTPTATAGATSAASSAPGPSFGQSIDAEITVIKARVASLEAGAKSDWKVLVAWVKAQWPHFVTWAALAASSSPVIDIVKKVL